MCPMVAFIRSACIISLGLIKLTSLNDGKIKSSVGKLKLFRWQLIVAWASRKAARGKESRLFCRETEQLIKSRNEDEALKAK